MDQSATSLQCRWARRSPSVSAMQCAGGTRNGGEMQHDLECFYRESRKGNSHRSGCFALQSNQTDSFLLRSLAFSAPSSITQQRVQNATPKALTSSMPSILFSLA